MHIEGSSDIPLYKQIFEHYRKGIESGAFRVNSRMPSIRGLAEDLGCSRNTVESAYRLLAQEGFIEAKPGSGYVVQDPSFLSLSPSSDTRPKQRQQPKRTARYDFTYGNLQKGTFPATAWRNATNDVLLSVACEAADTYADPFGEMDLRSEIAWRLSALRDIDCDPERVIVQNGTQGSVQSLLAFFDNTKDAVAMEDPGYTGVRRVFERNRFAIKPVRVVEGSDVLMDDVRRSNAKLVYVTPSSQFPTCEVMSLDTRQQLLAWAVENDAFILEDDYCRDFRYKERPVPPLASMDEDGRVIYMETFSKTLSPSLRLNYIVLPEALADRWREVYADAYPAVPWLTQTVLAQLMRKGYWDRHVRKMQARNRKKYETLIAAIRKHMKGRVSILENGTGLHLLVKLHDERPHEELVEAAWNNDVKVYSTDQYWMDENHAMKGSILIGFSAIEEEDIEPGIQALAKAWFG